MNDADTNPQLGGEKLDDAVNSKALEVGRGLIVVSAAILAAGEELTSETRRSRKADWRRAAFALAVADAYGTLG